MSLTSIHSARRVAGGAARLGPMLYLASVLALGLMTAAPALAHGSGTENVMVTLDATPPALGGIRVELHNTLAPQIVVENTSTTALEILATDGAPFLRIGPGGVEANVNAPDWYRFYSASGVPLPQPLRTLPAGRKLAPEWKIVSRTPAWGWFDSRIATETMKVPHQIEKSSVPTPFRSWKIPLRVDGRQVALSGRFQFMPQQRGYYDARLTSAPEIAPGVFLQVLPGPVPGFMIDNSSATPLTILDTEGKPFLEVGPAGVRANARSVSWLASGQAESRRTPLPPDTDKSPLWQVRSSTPRASWLDPRAAVAAGTGKKKGTAHPGQNWSIPFVHDGVEAQARGVTQWVDEAAAPDRVPVKVARVETQAKAASGIR